MTKYKHLIYTLLALVASIAASGLIASTANAVFDSSLSWDRWNEGSVSGTIQPTFTSNTVPVVFSGSPPNLRASSVEFRITSSGDSGGIVGGGGTRTCTANFSLSMTSAGEGEISASGGSDGCSDAISSISGTVSVGSTGNAPDNVDWADPGSGDEDEEEASSCVVEGSGWLVCTIAMTMARAMDGLYSLLEGLLVIPNLNVDTSEDANNGMYNAWQLVRNIANLAFIIAFLVIIFSHITSVGISNYNIKKMLPRLIISAILVNVSYWVSAIAVDASNIIGNSVYDMLQGIRMNHLGVIDSGGQWTMLIELMLAGGAVVVTAGAVLAPGAAGAALTAAFWIAWPALAGALLAAIVAIIVIAIRHALVVVLIIISPLAFVAFLLPNTEKLFNTWRKLLTAMLVFYPLVSLIFAGAQLTSILILQSLEDVDGFTMHLIALALFIQVAPLVLLPKIVSMGSGLIGRLTGSMTNKSSGLVNKARSLADEKRELNAGKFMYRRKPQNKIESALQRAAKERGRRRLGRQSALDANKNLQKADYLDSNRGRESTKKAIDAELESRRAQDAADAAAETEIPIALRLRAKGASLDKSSAEAKTEQAMEEFLAGSTVNPMFNDMKAKDADGNLLKDDEDGKTIDTRELSDLQGSMLAAKSDIDTATSATAIARNVQTEQRAKDILKDATLAEQAGGIDSAGMARAQASAISTLNQKEDEELRASAGLMNEANLSKDEYLKLARGLGDVKRVTADGREFNFSGSDPITQFAATEKALGSISTGDVHDLVNESGSWSDTQRKILADGLVKNGHTDKAPQYGSRSIDDIKQGRIIHDKNGPTEEQQKMAAEGQDLYTTKDLTKRVVDSGKMGAKQLASAHKSTLNMLIDVMPELNPQAQADIIKDIEEVSTNVNLRQAVKPESKKVLDKIYGGDIFAISKSSGGGSPSSDRSTTTTTTTAAGTQSSAQQPQAAPQQTQASPQTQQSTPQQPQGYQGVLDVRNVGGQSGPASVEQNITNSQTFNDYSTSNYRPVGQPITPPGGASRFQQSPGGVYTPQPPAGYQQSPGGLYVPPSAQAASSPQPQPPQEQPEPPRTYPPTDSMGGTFLK